MRSQAMTFLAAAAVALAAIPAPTAAIGDDLGGFQKIRFSNRLTDDQIDAILQKRPLAPTNRNLFSTVAYPSASPMAPAAGPPPTETEVEKITKHYLRDSFPFDPKAQKAGLALYNSPEAKAKILNPSLRAALVGLLGTAAEPAIDFILNEKTAAGLPKVKNFGFGVPAEWVGDPGGARSFVEANDQMSAIFNPRYQAENPFQFTKLMAHEPLHSDAPVANLEEVINLAIDISIYLEQLSKHPELAKPDTELTRRSNTNALARLNSGSGTNLGLFASNNHQPILPGSPLTFKSWFEQFQNTPNLTETPGNPLLKKYLANMAKPGTVVPANPNFSMDTLNFIDQNSNNLSKRQLVHAARALKLDVRIGDDSLRADGPRALSSALH